MQIEPRKTPIKDMNFSDLPSGEPLSNMDNYGPYAAIAYGKNVYVNTNSITRETWQNHYDSVLNILKDGIETDEVQQGFVNITFADGVVLDLSLVDYLINLMLWTMIIRTNSKIESKHVFFEKYINKKSIKNYIDKHLIKVNRRYFSNRELNNIIDDTLVHFHDIDKFAFFLANTVNLEDSVFLMEKNEEFYKALHPDLSNVPLEDVKSTIAKHAQTTIDIINNSEKYLGYQHCLAAAFQPKEGVNAKQYQEVSNAIGTKPDGRGGIFEKPITNSFINGGVANPVDYFIESSTGRTAQIIKYKNVGSSGHFARLLGLNNMDSYIRPEPHYDCCSKNFVRVTIKNDRALSMLVNRYYRLQPNGMEMMITEDDKHLIGREIYLRSPITCASAARGEGICYKCYGDLAYTAYDAEASFGINVGRIASEIVSSSLTQRLLSAKHLLETFVEKITWCPKFDELFEIEGNMVRLNMEVIDKDKLIIDPESIERENEEDDDLEDEENFIYNEFITEFEVSIGNEIFPITNDKGVKLYISSELNKVIRSNAKPIDDKVHISFKDLKNCESLFIIPIENNELSKTLEQLKALIDNSKVMAGMDLHTNTQALIDTVIEGGLDVSAVHLEVIMMNQYRDPEDILERAKWYNFNPPYEILPLKKALRDNPSITISLSYQNVGRQLYNPLTYRKNGASFMDLFFMKRPQYAIQNMDPPSEDKKEHRVGDYVPGIVYFGDPNRVTVSETADKDLDNEDAINGRDIPEEDSDDE